MTTAPPPENPKFDVDLEPAPRKEVLDTEEDEQSKREREAALASTFDDALAHNGKTDEELIEERQDETRMILDAAIVVGIAVAVAEHEALDVEEVVPLQLDDDGGD